MSKDNEHVLTTAFKNNYELKIFKLLYETSNLNFRKIFFNHQTDQLYNIGHNHVKILEFILMKGHKIPKQILK